ncbi:MAG TPA: hypothetical protein VK325_02940 [Pseudoxanthomonas sp.]|nr:hypothetical protein [Pseudoxanthomonas sp.]
MAMVLGLLLPVAETARRANQLRELANFFSWFDDYMLGALLVLVSCQALRGKKDFNLYLIAIWGIAVGGHFLSFLGQFKYHGIPGGDPGLFSTTFVAIVKGIILTYMLIGLILSIKGNKAG